MRTLGLAIIALFARPIVTAVLGSPWLPAVGLVRVLAVAIPFRLLQKLGSAVLKGRRRNAKVNTLAGAYA